MSEISQKQLESGKNKSLVKKDKDAEIKKVIDEKVSDVVFYATSETVNDPDSLIEKLKVAMREIITNKGELRQGVSKKEKRRVAEIIMEIQMEHGLETHFPLLQLVAKTHVPLITRFAKQLTIEYDCKTPSERALVQVAAIAYAKILEFTERLFYNLNANDPWLSHEKNGLKSVLGKELDRANRCFLVALATLKQIKNPTIEVSIKTKTAFVAQNQQINAINNLNQKDNEIIDPK